MCVCVCEGVGVGGYFYAWKDSAFDELREGEGIMYELGEWGRGVGGEIMCVCLYLSV